MERVKSFYEALKADKAMQESGGYRDKIRNCLARAGWGKIGP